MFNTSEILRLLQLANPSLQINVLQIRLYSSITRETHCQINIIVEITQVALCFLHCTVIIDQERGADFQHLPLCETHEVSQDFKAPENWAPNLKGTL